MAEGNLFFVPQRMHVQLAADEDNPDGGVVTLSPGWHDDVDDERVLEHPIVARLIEKAKHGGPRMQQRAEMERKVAAGEASLADQHKLLQDQAKEEQDERNAAIEEWNGRAQQAADRGVTFNEEHPDPQVNEAKYLTGDPGVISAGGMQSKILERSVRPGHERDDHEGTQRRRIQRHGERPSQPATTGTPTAPPSRPAE